MTHAEVAHCRLCGGALSETFHLTVLGEHDVAYFSCAECNSLQTEPPYWLDEAYSSSLASLDTGAVQRNLSNMAAVAATASILRLRNILDFGGGDGLLCRMLRDLKFNCFVSDRYAAASYSQRFTEPDFRRADLLLAFEVAEHFSAPREDFAKLLQSRPCALLMTTERYEGQGADWWYLTPETGQHVFFYSRRALNEVAAQFGYRLHEIGRYLLFLESGWNPGFRLFLLRLLLHRIAIRFVRAALLLLPAGGVARDFENLRKRQELPRPPAA